MSSPDGRVRLAELSALSEGAVALELPDLDLIVVTQDGVHLVYDNRCPHRGTTLDWSPGRLWSQDGRHLQCATHGALFEPATGVCVQGPCVGDRLRPRRVEVSDGALWLLR